MLFVLISEAGVWPPEIRGPFTDHATAQRFIDSLQLPPNTGDKTAEIIESQPVEEQGG